MNNTKDKAISNSRIIIYVCKLWILTNFISSLIIQFLDAHNQKGKFNYDYFWGGMLVFFVFGLFSSLPAILVIGLIIKKISKNKYILILSSIFFVFISFRLADFNYIKFPSLIIYPVVYSIVMSVLISFLSLGEIYIGKNLKN